MEFAEVLKGRRSIRSYQDRSLSDPDVERLIDLARHAPSSMNGQPWHFVVVRNQQTKSHWQGSRTNIARKKSKRIPQIFWTRLQW